MNTEVERWTREDVKKLIENHYKGQDKKISSIFPHTNGYVVTIHNKEEAKDGE